MRNLLVYPALGLRSSDRKRRLAEKLLRKARTYRAQGLPTRIPFLKASFCGQDAGQGQTGCVQATDRILIRMSLKTLLDPYLALREAIAINSASADTGSQLFYSDDREMFSICLRPAGAKTSWIGDLKLSTLLASGPEAKMEGSKAAYFDTLFQVFMESGIEDTKKALLHETEHAKHLSLWRMIGLPIKLFPHKDREYLAMMVPLMEHGETSLVCAARQELKSNLESKQNQYICASARFLYRLATRYGMPPHEADLAVVAELVPEEARAEDFELLERMKRYAWIEYRKEYARLFGLTLEDIKDTIAGLPIV